MKDFNHVMLTGRLTRDPEGKPIKDGQGRDSMVATFTLAVNRWPSKTGESQADFIMFRCFGQRAETIVKYAKAPMKLTIHGEIRSESYEKDGKRNYYTYVLVDDFRLPDKPKNDNKENQASAANNMTQEQQGQQTIPSQQPASQRSNNQPVRPGNSQSASQSQSQGQRAPRPAGYQPNGNNMSGENNHQNEGRRRPMPSRPQGYSATDHGALQNSASQVTSMNAPMNNPMQQPQGQPQINPQNSGQGTTQNQRNQQQPQQPAPFFGSIPPQFNGFDNILDEYEDDLPFH